MMTTPIDRESVERLAEMVAIACDILQDEAADAIREYDGAECDGSCVADDLESAFEALRAALDEAEAEKQRAVAAALREAAEAIDCGCSGWCMHPDKCPKEDVDAILSLIDPDAGAALDRYVKERSDEALREAADAVEDYCSDAPDLAGHGHSGAIRDVILGTRGDE